MIHINQIKISIFDINGNKEKEEELLYLKAARLLRCGTGQIRKLKVEKRSVDARDKNDIKYVYSINVKLSDHVTGPTAETEKEYISYLRNRNIGIYEGVPLRLPGCMPGIADAPSFKRPVVIGTGPCGLFAALVLSEAGLRPLIIERGSRMEERIKKTDVFFITGKPDPDCNIQFGEGGAGTFSDGKLNTGIKNQEGYIFFVLKTFASYGADSSILYDQKPHIGTDVLSTCIKNMREHIKELGGEYMFDTRLEDIIIKEGRLSGLRLTGTKTGKECLINTHTAVLATGHSARDTYRMLYKRGFTLLPKAFAAGVRVRHDQLLIDKGLYGAQRLDEKRKLLGPASYKLAGKAANGRNIYTFCMCPGGYIINSSSEEGRLCINGMSYSGRDSGSANAALIVNITPEDLGGGVFCCMDFQEEMEKKAYSLAGGCIPYETFLEFKKGEAVPSWISGADAFFKGASSPADVKSIFPVFMQEAIEEGMQEFGKRIPGFDSDDAIIAGAETRTSSPVRILRDENGFAPGAAGLYPAGEGAGYAGGITSAAADGIKTALKILKEYGYEV